MGGLGFWEFMVIAFLVLLFFGSNKLPDIGRSLGKAIKDFKGSLSGSGPQEDSPRGKPQDTKDPPR